MPRDLQLHARVNWWRRPPVCGTERCRRLCSALTGNGGVYRQLLLAVINEDHGGYRKLMKANRFASFFFILKIWPFFLEKLSPVVVAEVGVAIQWHDFCLESGNPAAVVGFVKAKADSCKLPLLSSILHLPIWFDLTYTIFIIKYINLFLKTIKWFSCWKWFLHVELSFPLNFV